MNRIYKLKFDRRRNTLVVVSELTTGTGKTESTGHVAGLLSVPFRKLLGTLSPLALATGLATGMLPMMVLATPALPTGGQVVAGSGSISSSGNQMTIHQQSQNMVASWNTFDIGKNHTVQFVQPGSSSVALNRVTGGRESQILGTLKASGQVMLINPAGVMFGRGAQVNTAGLVASTKNISNADFMKGNYTLSGGNPGAQVVNQGSLTTTKGGHIVLAGDRVQNSGSIRTPGGKTALVAADTVKLQLDNGGLTSVSVNGSVVNALVENRGLVSATDGQVYLTARGREMLLNTVVNNSGTVEALGLRGRGGEIVLDGGDSGVVSQTGKVLADSTTGRGGRIVQEGQNIHLAANSLTSATGKIAGGEVSVGGGWQGKDSRIKNAEKVVMDKTAVIDVSAGEKGDGGQAVLWSEEYTNFRGTILAKGGAQAGNGGRVETSSHKKLQAFGQVDASAVAGKGGEWLLDPTDVTIVDQASGDSVGLTNTVGVFTPVGTESTIINTSIENQLNAGTSVTVKTSGEDTEGRRGNITVSAAIEKTSGGDASLTLEADGMLTVSQNITSTAGKLNITLLGAGSNIGMINVTGSNMITNGGNITLGRLNNTDSTTAMTVKIRQSNLNASGTENNGNINISAWNPDVNLGTDDYKDTVRNGAVQIDVTNSTLSGENIFLTSTQTGANSVQFPVLLNNATLNASNDITLTGYGSQDSKAASLELRGKNILNASGNISISNTQGEASSAIAVLFNGTNNSNKVNLTAGGNIILNGKGALANGIKTSHTVLNASAGTVTLRGETISGGVGVDVATNNTINAISVNVTGINTRGSGYGFFLNGLTLEGGVLNGTNVTLGSAGSGPDSTNVIKGSIFNTENLNRAMTAGIENMTQINATGLTLSDDNSDDWVQDFTGIKGGGWIFDGAEVNKNGNITLEGVGFINGNLNAGKQLTIDNEDQKLILDNMIVNVAGNMVLKGGTLNIMNSTLNGNSSDTQAHSFALQSGGMLTLGNTTVNSTGNGKVSIDLLVKNGITGMINVTGSNITTKGGNITLTQLNLDDGDGVRTSAMTVKIEGSNLNSTGEANGSISVSAWNPGINLSAAEYNNTVRNGGNLLQVTNSTLTGQDITLEGTQSGDNAANRPVYLNNATLNASKDITLIGNGSEDSRAHSLELRGKNILNASGNISISNTQGNGSSSSAPAVFLNGTSPLKTNLTAVGNIILNGNASVAAGVNVSNALMDASALNITGTTRTGSTGFTLSNLTLSGSVENGSSVSLSSAGSSAAASNLIGDNIFSGEGLKALLKEGAEHATQLNASVLSTRDSNSNSSTDDWEEDFTSTKGGGWIFRGASIEKKGNINLKGASFTNGTLTAGKDLTLDNGEKTLTLNGMDVTATDGNITLKAASGISYVGNTDSRVNMNANGNISVNASAGTVMLRNANLSSTTQSIDVYGKGSVGAWLEHVSMNASANNVTVYGEGRALYGSYFRDAAVIISGNTKFNAKKTNVTGVNTGLTTNDYTNAGVLLGRGVNTSVVFSGDSASVVGESSNGAGILWSENAGVALHHTLDISTSKFSITGNTSAALIPDDNPAGGIAFATSYLGNTVTFNISNNSEISIIGDAQGASGGVQGVVTYPPVGLGFNLQNKYIFNGEGNVTITGKSNDGDGVNLRGFDNTDLKGNMTIIGESESGTGVSFDNNLGISLQNATVTGTSKSGSGIEMVATSGNATLTNVTLNGTTDSGAAAISLYGSNVSVNGTINGNVTQGNGFGVALNGISNFTISGAQVNGTAVNGGGVVLKGEVNASKSARLSGYATGSGNGVEVQGNLTGTADNNAVVLGKATTGSAVKLTGKTDHVNITGSVSGGTGVELADKAQVLNTTVNGSAEFGSGVAVTGRVTLDDPSVSNLTAQSTDGSGLALKDGATITASGTEDSDESESTEADSTKVVELKGTSENGSGVSTSGNVLLTRTLLNGTASVKGSGVTLSGNLTLGDNLSGVKANTANGTAIDLRDVTFNATAHGETSLILNQQVTGSGTAIKVSGDTVLKNVKLDGNASAGKGVVIDGNLTTDQSVSGTTESGIALTVAGHLVNSNGQVVSGKATGSGTGVSITGNTGGNTVTGTSETGTGALLGEGAVIGDGSTVNGASQSGIGAMVDGRVVNDGNIRGHSDGNTGLHVQGALSGSGSAAGSSARATYGTVLVDSVDGNTLSGTTALGGGTFVGDGTSIVSGKVTGEAVHGSGVVIAGKVSNLGTISGTSQQGTGTELRSDVSLIGDGQIDGVSTAGAGVTVSGSIGDNRVSGTSVDGHGAVVSDGTSVGANGAVSGASENNSGTTISGNVSNQGSISGASQSLAGTEMSGKMSGSGTLSGTTDSGTGVSVSGDIRDNAVSGYSASGTGVQLDNGAGIGAAATVSGISGTSTGLAVAGSVNNEGTLSGASTSGTGTDLLSTGSLTGTGAVTGTTQGEGVGTRISGAVSGNTVGGASATGTGVQVDSGAVVSDVSLNGNTQSGTGVYWGDAVEHNRVAIRGEAERGVGVYLEDGTVLNDTTVNGSTKSSAGVLISGDLSGGTVNGEAQGSGDGVKLKGGTVSGSSTTGNARDGSGVLVSGPVTVSEGTLTGISTNGTGLNVRSSLNSKDGAVITGVVNTVGSGVQHNMETVLSQTSHGILDARIAQTQSALNLLRDGSVPVDAEASSDGVYISVCADAEGHQGACQVIGAGMPGAQGVSMTPVEPGSTTSLSDAR